MTSIAAVEQRFRQVRADEAGRTGDDDALWSWDVTDAGRRRRAASVRVLVEEAPRSVSHMIFRSRRTDQFSM